jgi:hypothetical protein
MSLREEHQGTFTDMVILLIHDFTDMEHMEQDNLAEKGERK